MNDFSDLEAELKQLRPARPSETLVLRVERALRGHACRPAFCREKKLRGFGWLSLGLGVATAAAAFLFLARPGVEHASPAQPTIAASSATPRDARAIAASHPRA